MPSRRQPRPRIGDFVTAGGTHLHVRQDGPTDARAVLLIHGFTGSVHSFDRLAPLLADSFRVIRVDLLGHGCTGGSAAPDAPAQADAVAAVVTQLGATDLTAVGHSFGADVAIGVAQRDAARRVVVLGQAPDYSYATFPAGSVLMTVPAIAALVHWITPPAAVTMGARIGFAPGFRIDRGKAEQIVLDHAAMAPTMFRTVLAERRARLAANPLDRQLRELDVPSLAILGRHDRMYDCAKTTARYEAAGVAVEVIEDAGHSPNVENPAAVAALVRRFATTT